MLLCFDGNLGPVSGLERPVGWLVAEFDHDARIIFFDVLGEVDVYVYPTVGCGGFADRFTKEFLFVLGSSHDKVPVALGVVADS